MTRDVIEMWYSRLPEQEKVREIRFDGASSIWGLRQYEDLTALMNEWSKKRNIKFVLTPESEQNLAETRIRQLQKSAKAMRMHAKLDYTYQIHAFRYANNTSVLVPHEALGGRAPFMEYHAKNVHKWKSTAYATNGVIIQKKTIFFFFLTFNAISCLLAVNGGEQVYKNRHPTDGRPSSGESKSKSYTK